MSRDTVAGNPYVRFIDSISEEERNTPSNLYDSSGVAFLEATFAEIDRHWGSVSSYLRCELGIGPGEIEKLRAIYLE